MQLLSSNIPKSTKIVNFEGNTSFDDQVYDDYENIYFIPVYGNNLFMMHLRP